MSSVDDRIVNMKFNSSDFTSGATKSKKSLDDLEGALSKTAQGKGLGQLEQGVSGVSSKFSALKVAGVAALATIASKATSAGLNLLKSLTIDPIMQGFQEYQTNLESVQTIMANTGEKVGVVNKGLDQLNTYADKTIYNFSQMAKNVGTFTAAGVDLKTSIDSIKGIANLAALSGSNSQQASTAMYQLSQAIASGKVGLQDWNSVVNAGMGGKQFQTALARTAEQMGTLNKGAVKLVKEGSMEKLMINGMSFRDSIAAKPGETPWLTSGALVETLKQVAGGYSEAELRAKGYSKAEVKAIMDLQKRAFDAATKIKTLPQLVQVIQESVGSTFASIFRTVMGDFQQSKKLWTDVGFAILGPQGFLTKTQDSLKGFFEDWAKLGGRDLALDAFGNTFSALGKVFTAVGQAWREVFPPATTNWLFELTKGFRDFSLAIQPSKSTLSSIKSIFAGVFSVLHIGWSVVKGVGSAFVSLFKGLFSGSEDARGGILSLLGSVGEIITSFDKWLTGSGRLSEFLGNIGRLAGSALAPVAAAIGLVVKAMAGIASGEGFGSFTDSINEIKIMVLDFVSNLLRIATQITAPFKSVSGFLGDMKGKIDGVRSSLTDAGKPFDSVAEKAKSMRASVGGPMEQVKSIVDKTGQSWTTAMNKVKGSTDSVTSSVKGFAGALKGETVSASTQTGEALASAGETASSRWETLKSVVSTIGGAISEAFSNMGNVVSWIRGQFNDLFGGMDALDWASVFNAVLTGGILLTIRDLLEPITGFKEQFAGIGEVAKGTFDQLTDTFKTMQNEVKAKMLMEIAIAVALLTASLVALSFIKMADLAKGLGAITIMLGLLSGTLFVLGKVQSETNLMVLGASLLLISFAMVNLAAAVAMFGNMDMGTLAKGFGALALALGLMVTAANSMKGIQGQLVAAGAAILIISVAMQALALAVLMFGNMDMGTLAKGLGAIAVALILIVPSLMLLAAMQTGVLAAATAILIVSGAMIALSAAVLAFGNMDMGTLAKGFVAIALGLGLMVAALYILAPMAPMVLIVAQAMALLSVAMIGLAVAVGMFGSMDMSTLAIGFAAVALGLGLLLAAAAVAMAVAPGLAILSSSIMMLGAAMALAGVGMLAFSTGLAIMAATGAAGFAVITGAIHVFMAMLPSIAVQVAAAFVSFLGVIAAAMPKIRSHMKTIFTNMIGVVRDAIPQLRGLFQDLIDAGIKVVNDSIPKMVEAGFNIIDRFLESAAKHVPKMAENGRKLISELLDAIGKELPKLADKGFKTIIKFMDGITKAINDNEDDLRRSALDMAGAIIDGMTGGLLSEGMQKVRDAAQQIADALPGWMRKVLHIDSPSKVTWKIGYWTAKGLARGVQDNIGLAVNAALNMANALVAAGNKAILKAEQAATKARKNAYAADAKADLTAKRAAARRRIADKYARKHKDKKFKEERAQHEKQAKALERLAARQRAAADRRSKTADSAANKVESTRAFQEADAIGRGEIMNERAQSLADRANRMLAEANAEAAEAKNLRGREAKKMRNQTRKDAQAAKRLANAARKAHNEANKFFQEDVDARILRMQQEAKIEAASEADRAKVTAKIYEDRAAVLEQQAKEASKTAAELLKKAEEEKDETIARALLDKAEAAADAAKQAKDEAEQLHTDAKELLNPGSSTGGGGGGSLTPSRSVLEDAAKAIDRYTESLHQAEELAAAQQGPVQFVQNNYSPKALSTTEIYRQNKNLVSAAAVKMGVNSDQKS